MIAFDAPGTGRSATPPIPLSLEALARVAEGVLDELGVEQADVLGYSFGGAVAQRLARRAPERVRRLVLAATTPGWGGVPGSLRTLARMSTPLRYYWRSVLRVDRRRPDGRAPAPRRGVRPPPRRGPARQPARPARLRLAAGGAEHRLRLAAVAAPRHAADAGGDRRRRPGDAARQRAAARPQAARRAACWSRPARGTCCCSTPTAARCRRSTTSSATETGATRSRSPSRCSTPSCAPAPSPTRWR